MILPLISVSLLVRKMAKRTNAELANACCSHFDCKQSRLVLLIQQTSLFSFGNEDKNLMLNKQAAVLVIYNFFFPALMVNYSIQFNDGFQGTQ